MSSPAPEPEWMRPLHAQLYEYAQWKLRSEKAGHSLQPTLLVNDACLKLMAQRNLASADLTQMRRAGAKIIRNLLVDYARARNSPVRGGDREREPLPVDILIQEMPADFLLLHEALEAFAKVDLRAVEIVELRYFSGMSNAEIAGCLNVGIRTVDGALLLAKAWLRRYMKSRSEE